MSKCNMDSYTGVGRGGVAMSVSGFDGGVEGMINAMKDQVQLRRDFGIS